ncbi:hypothetical protein SPBR_04824 [Sporothrix brasiliensis 5110]|uniref:Uncharacterized protein n=1 Tax=Sporothrix brasiliensis 5110 TaxID=1398154 RepID=A0A0C2F8K9_9PEZI|nr:uncharacterized protein SPBR_04824 [Sporothrix brasiliensis 5110]KIH87398.1 hypothetical protein SPBR_04824 [Sporothrix brasiliensis 5110]
MVSHNTEATRPSPTTSPERVVSDQDLVESPSTISPPALSGTVDASRLVTAPRSPGTLEVPPMTGPIEFADWEPMMRSVSARRNMRLGQVEEQQQQQQQEEEKIAPHAAGDEEDEDADFLYMRNRAVGDSDDGDSLAVKYYTGSGTNSNKGAVDTNIDPLPGRVRRHLRRVFARLSDIRSAQRPETHDAQQTPRAAVPAGADENDVASGSGCGSSFGSSRNGYLADGEDPSVGSTAHQTVVRPHRRSHNYDNATYGSGHRGNNADDYLYAPEDISVNPKAPVFPGVDDDDGAHQGGRLSEPGRQAFNIEVADDTAVLAAALVASASSYYSAYNSAYNTARGPAAMSEADSDPDNQRVPQPPPASELDLKDGSYVPLHPAAQPLPFDGSLPGNSLSDVTGARPPARRIQFDVPPPPLRRERSHYYPSASSVYHRLDVADEHSTRIRPDESYLGAVPIGPPYPVDDDDDFFRPPSPDYLFGGGFEHGSDDGFAHSFEREDEREGEREGEREDESADERDDQSEYEWHDERSLQRSTSPESTRNLDPSPDWSSDSISSYITCSSCDTPLPNPMYIGWYRPRSPSFYDDDGNVRNDGRRRRGRGHRDRGHRDR